MAGASSVMFPQPTRAHSHSLDMLALQKPVAAASYASTLSSTPSSTGSNAPLLATPTTAAAMPIMSVAVHTQQPPQSHSHGGRQRPASERTPLVHAPASTSRLPRPHAHSFSLPATDNVYPLPWFSSPEWSKKTTSPKRAGTKEYNPQWSRSRKTTTKSGRYGADLDRVADASFGHALLGAICCHTVSSDSETDLEVGAMEMEAKQAAAEEGAVELEGFKSCVQVLVVLIVLIAAALVVIIILQPFPDSVADT